MGLDARVQVGILQDGLQAQARGLKYVQYSEGLLQPGGDQARRPVQEGLRKEAQIAATHLHNL